MNRYQKYFILLVLAVAGFLFYRKEFSHPPDKTFFISKTELAKLQPGDEKDLNIGNMKPGEELSIYRKLRGCFGGFSEKIILRKRDKGYSIAFFSDRKNSITLQRDVDEAFTDTLALFQKRFQNYFKTAMPFGCTTTSTYVFTRENIAWEFTDGSCPNHDPTGYDNIINAFIPWFGKNQADLSANDSDTNTSAPLMADKFASKN